MGRWRWMALLGLAAGCAPVTDEPFWALDPIYVEPTTDGVYGVQSWELFGEGWGRAFRRRHYLCGILVEFEGTPLATPCDGCTHAWSVVTTLGDSDCDDTITADANYLSLSAIGLGADLPDVEGKVPHDESSGAFADYGYGWISYGWAYPEALDQGEEVATTEWDGTEPFLLWPAYAWEIVP